MAFIEPGACFIKDLISSIGYPGLAALMALDATILPVPSAVVMGFAGHLSYEGRFDIFLVALVGALGSTCGSLLMYAIGRYCGRPFLDRLGRYIGLGEKRVASADRWFSKYGSWAVFICQLLPVARDLISLPAGIVRMGAFKFAGLAFLGSLPFCLALAGLGFLAGPSWESAVEIADAYDMLLLAAVMVPVTAYWALRKLLPAGSGDLAERR